VLALGAGPSAYTAQTVRPPDHVGFAVRYSPGVMESVARRRGIPWQECMVAWTYARDKDIGRTWLHVEGPAGEANCLVIDLPRPGRDKRNLIARDIEVELGYRSGARVCGRRWQGRAVECKVRTWIARQIP